MTDSKPIAADTLNTDDSNHVWHHITQHKALETTPAMVITHGDGMTVTDNKGNEYLDATSGGVWTVNVGYGRTAIADAVHDQLTQMPYFSGAVGTLPGAQFAQALAERMPGLDRVYYANSGSEANEKAYKIIRQIAHISGKKQKTKIIFRDRDYHGSTYGALSSTGHDQRTAQYGPFLPDFVKMPHCCCYRCPFNKQYGDCNIECAQTLETIIEQEGPDTVGGVVLETITAGGGAIVPPPEYFPIIQSICQKYDVILHLDEVVCGMGRTGTWFGYQHFEVTPDIITLAKGLASGYAAISVMAAREAIFDVFKSDPKNPLHYFRDISTFGGCTAGPAAGLANLKIIEQENLLKNTTDTGHYLFDQIKALQDKHSIIGDIRGKGLFIGIELVLDRETKEPMPESVLIQLVAHCMRNGVMIGRTNRSFEGYNNVLLLSPALICSRSDADTICWAIDQALSDQTVIQSSI